MSTERETSMRSEEPAQGNSTEVDIEGFTLNPYTTSILAMLEQQCREQGGAGSANDSAGIQELTRVLNHAASVAAAGSASSGTATVAAGSPLPPPAVAATTTTTTTATPASMGHLFDDDEAVAEQRRRREGQLSRIEKKREASRRRCDLVDELFQKSVERRMRAMRRVAADPPADRLVGRDVTQYIPVGLLPKEQQRQVSAFMEKEDNSNSRHRVASATAGNAVPPAPTSGKTTGDDGNALVFLTEMDSPDDGTKWRPQESGQKQQRRTGATRSSSREGSSGGGNGEGDIAGYQDASSSSPPLFLDDEVTPEDPRQVEMREHWRELGYNVVFVSATGKGGGRRLPTSTTRGSGAGRGESVPTTTTLAVNADALRGGGGGAVPSESRTTANTVLVQRRLPREEKVTPAEASGSTRRRPVGGSSARWLNTQGSELA